VECDRWVFFGLSNEMPEGAELNALYDRLDLRVIVERIQSSSGFVQMLKSQELGPVVPTLTPGDIEAAQAEVRQVEITNDVYAALLTLRNELARAGVEPTDRRFARSLQVIRSSAWLRGVTEAEVDDMRDLRHVLWATRDEKATVDSHVLQLAAPLDAEAMKLRDEVDKLSEEYEIVFSDSDNKSVRNKKAIDLHSKLERATEELLGLRAQLAKGRRSEIMDDIHTRLEHMNDTILREVFNLDPGARKK
jgi:Mg-chelatase subunit ChlI